MLDLRNMKVDELKEIAREYSIDGIWKKTKDALITDILNMAEKYGHTDKYFDSAASGESDETTVEETESETTEKKPRGKLIEYNGKSQTLGKWAEELGFTPQTLYARLYLSNWPVDKAFETPSKRKTKEEE